MVSRRTQDVLLLAEEQVLTVGGRIVFLQCSGYEDMKLRGGNVGEIWEGNEEFGLDMIKIYYINI